MISNFHGIPLNPEKYRILFSVTPATSGNVATVDIWPLDPTLYMQDSFDVSFRCSVPDDPQATFLHWEKDGQRLYGNNDRRQYESANSKLMIYDLRVDDSGLYTCIAKLHNTVQVEASTTLTVKPAIRIMCTEAQFLDVGSGTKISCSVSGDTITPTFKSWLKGAIPLETSDKYRCRLMDLSNLVIINFSHAHLNSSFLVKILHIIALKMT